MKSYNEYLILLELTRIEEELLQLEVDMLIEEEMLLESFPPTQQHQGQKVPTPNWISKANRPWSSPVFDEPKNNPSATGIAPFVRQKEEMPTLPSDIAAKVAKFGRDVDPQYVAIIIKRFKTGVFNQDMARKALKGTGVPENEIAGILGDPPGESAPKAAARASKASGAIDSRDDKISELEDMLIKALEAVDPVNGVDEKTKVKIENIIRLLYTLRSKNVLVSKKRSGFNYEPDTSSEASRLEIERKKLTLLLPKLRKSRAKDAKQKVAEKEKELADIEKELRELNPLTAHRKSDDPESSKMNLSTRKINQGESNRMARIRRLMFRANLGHLFPSVSLTGPIAPIPGYSIPKISGSGLPDDPSSKRKRLEQMLAHHNAMSQKAPDAVQSLTHRAKAQAITKVLLKMDLAKATRDFDDAQAAFKSARTSEEEDRAWSDINSLKRKKEDLETIR